MDKAPSRHGRSFLGPSTRPLTHSSFSAFTATCTVLGPGISASPHHKGVLGAGWGGGQVSTHPLSWPEMKDTELTFMTGAGMPLRHQVQPHSFPEALVKCAHLPGHQTGHLNRLNLGYQIWLQSLYLGLKEKKVQFLHPSSMWLRREVWVNLDTEANWCYP